jgi:hypothetical protein
MPHCASTSVGSQASVPDFSSQRTRLHASVIEGPARITTSETLLPKPVEPDEKSLRSLAMANRVGERRQIPSQSEVRRWPYRTDECRAITNVFDILPLFLSNGISLSVFKSNTLCTLEIWSQMTDSVCRRWCSHPSADRSSQRADIRTRRARCKAALSWSRSSSDTSTTTS